MKIAIIINTHRFTPALEAELQSSKLKEEFNVDYDVFVKTPEEMDVLLKEFNYEAYNALLIGGGDGTVAKIVQAVVGHDLPVAILPLGTFNLLAKSLNYPNDLTSLFALIKNNKTKKIDLGEVDKHIILNHAWIGFYYELLKTRKKYKHILGNSRLLKAIFNTFNLFKRLPFYSLEVKANEEIHVYKTYLIAINNNESHSSLFNFGEHKYLSSGLLSVTILNCKNRWDLFVFLWTALLRGAKYSSHVTTFNADKLTITAKAQKAKIVVDGELYELSFPLHFSIHPKELTVFI